MYQNGTIPPLFRTITAEGVHAYTCTMCSNDSAYQQKIISDRDTRFTSRFAKDLAIAWGLCKTFPRPITQHTDGSWNVPISWLEQYLRFWTNHKQNKLDDVLTSGRIVHNTWYNATTKNIPLRLLMGYEPQATGKSRSRRYPQITTCLDQMIEARRVCMKHDGWQKHRGNDGNTNKGSRKVIRCG